MKLIAVICHQNTVIFLKLRQISEFWKRLDIMALDHNRIFEVWGLVKHEPSS